MKIHHIQEPVLEFGGGNTHVDIRFGLSNFGPLSSTRPSSPKHPSRINLGIVGTSETVEGVQQWLERCKGGIHAKKSSQPNLFPRFPGFGQDSVFKTELRTDNSISRYISLSRKTELLKISKVNKCIEESVNIFLEEIRYLAENQSVDVIMCAIPMDLLIKIKFVEPEVEPEENEFRRLNFHNALKAKAMAWRKPIQILLPPTYDETKKIPKRFGQHQDGRQLQDEATRAWNVHTALYYKAGGALWRLQRELSRLSACYVGISFYETLDNSRLLTSIAQVFNELGEGMVVRGATVEKSKDDRQPHLSAEDAFDLMDNALKRYRDEHHTLPARVVLHKTSKYSDNELDGLTQAVTNNRIDSADFISVDRHPHVRLFRYGAYPPLRGTFVSLDETNHLLYTKGSVEFYSTYPGQYIPWPILNRCEKIEQTPRFLAKEILALSKMNWNTTQFDGSLPITVEAARNVGGILKYIGEGRHVEPRYSYYM